jgi:hypothetical protein
MEVRGRLKGKGEGENKVDRIQGEKNGDEDGKGKKIKGEERWSKIRRRERAVPGTISVLDYLIQTRR